MIVCLNIQTFFFLQWFYYYSSNTFYRLHLSTMLLTVEKTVFDVFFSKNRRNYQSRIEVTLWQIYNKDPVNFPATHFLKSPFRKILVYRTPVSLQLLQDKKHLHTQSRKCWAKAKCYKFFTDPGDVLIKAKWSGLGQNTIIQTQHPIILRFQTRYIPNSLNVIINLRYNVVHGNYFINL